MSGLLGPDGHKINGKPMQAEKFVSEIARLIRHIQNSRANGLPELCAQLEVTAQAGWRLVLDENVPTTRVEVSIVNNMKLDANGQVQGDIERVVRLGREYHEAMVFLVQEQRKAAGLPPLEAIPAPEDKVSGR